MWPSPSFLFVFFLSNETEPGTSARSIRRTVPFDACEEPQALELTTAVSRR